MSISDYTNDDIKTTPFFVQLGRTVELLNFETPVSGYHREVMYRFISETLALDARELERRLYNDYGDTYINYSTTGAVLFTLLASLTKTARKARHVVERIESGSDFTVNELCPELSTREDSEQLEREIYSMWILFNRVVLIGLPMKEVKMSVYVPSEIYNFQQL